MLQERGVVRSAPSGRARTTSARRWQLSRGAQRTVWLPGESDMYRSPEVGAGGDSLYSRLSGALASSSWVATGVRNKEGFAKDGACPFLWVLGSH